MSLIRPEPGISVKGSAFYKFSLAGIALLSGMVAVASYRYIFELGLMPPNIALNRLANPWLIIHATSAATALLLGPFQFINRLRVHQPALHRMAGRVYVLSCLIGGFSAFPLATGISTGPIAGVGFGALGGVWLLTTAVALWHIVNGRVVKHQQWMMRSFALTLSAVTLRLYLPVALFSGLDFAIAYRAIAWLCWLPNLAVSEWIIRSHRRCQLGSQSEIAADDE